MTYNTADDTYSKVYPAIEKYVNVFTHSIDLDMGP